MNEIEFSEIVFAICKRPRAYMPCGTLGHVISFLEGYSKAAGVRPHAHSGLSAFYEWLLKRRKQERMVPTLWEDLFDCTSTDESLLQEFAGLYREYSELGGTAESSGKEEADGTVLDVVA